jgi:hypothetical protein
MNSVDSLFTPAPKPLFRRKRERHRDKETERKTEQRSGMIQSKACFEAAIQSEGKE